MFPFLSVSDMGSRIILKKFFWPSYDIKWMYEAFQNKMTMPPQWGAATQLFFSENAEHQILQHLKRKWQCPRNGGLKANFFLKMRNFKFCKIFRCFPSFTNFFLRSWKWAQISSFRGIIFCAQIGHKLRFSAIIFCSDSVSRKNDQILQKMINSRYFRLFSWIWIQVCYFKEFSFWWLKILSRKKELFLSFIIFERPKGKILSRKKELFLSLIIYASAKNNKILSRKKEPFLSFIIYRRPKGKILSRKKELFLSLSYMRTRTAKYCHARKNFFFLS